MQAYRRRTLTSYRRACWLLLALTCRWDRCLLSGADAQNITSTAARNSTSGCFSTIKSLNEAMSTKDPFRVVEYTLCPHTTYSVGINRGIDGFHDGDEPLRPRSNSVIRCGESGSPQDNCTILGGDAQLQLVSSLHPESFRENVIVDGITFKSVRTGKVVVAIAAPGYVEFKKCIFKSHENSRVVAIIHQPVEQQEYLEVTFDSCVFESNSLFHDGSPTSSSLIGGGSSTTTLIIRNSVFVDNNLNDDEFRHSDIIEMEAGARIKMENNCFFDNDVIGDGVISVRDASDVLLTRGNYGTRIKGASCDFLFLERESSCTHYDFPQCVLDYTNGVLTPPRPGFVPELVVPTQGFEALEEPESMEEPASSSGSRAIAMCGFLLISVLVFS